MITKTKKRKKSPAQKLYTKMFNKACALWKEHAFLRDGRQCQVQKHFPGARLTHSDCLQVDHFVTRNDHNLFFNPQNSTVVCSNCNGAKNWRNGSPVEEMIRKIVTEREGGIAVGLMLDIHLSHQPNLLWKDSEWLEKQVIPMLEDHIKNLKEENGL